MAEQTGRRQVTSADVARAAGVSRATVSFVLNGTPNKSLTEATRERVRQAAERLGYAPSAAARDLRRGRSDVVLMLEPDWPLSLARAELARELSVGLAAAGLVLLTHRLDDGGTSIAHLRRALDAAAVIRFRSARPPVPFSPNAVELDVHLFGEGPLHFSQDRVGGIQAEHLLGRGHTRLGYALPPGPTGAELARGRAEGVRRTCAGHGRDAPVALVVEPAAPGAAVRAFLDAGVTAVCAFNDDVAMALLAGLRGLGRRAPGHLAVVGVDDNPPSAFTDPPLTTVRFDGPRTARVLTGVTVDALAGRAVGPTELLFAELVVRESA
ncbi:LacI family DNA-binding transcriptional regulator [Saccharothrix algeriensis]|uniref:DNA-binding LacI/PurR family transcriptional regulator n=3 Tax=Saccharothrix algeriensis TaxID=173560 RepID=A0ABS2SIS7_9PSEU|nr:LacI family DNA-binding transcriptional regulator [Saccharothrix algeriensis]MBM7815198.1 DNA-binding LacI/PurR family transcriptional regulator [Saccharothrix algeriensis]